MNNIFQFLEDLENLNEVHPDYRTEVTKYLKSLKGKSDKEIISSVAPKLFRAIKDGDTERAKIIKDSFKEIYPNLIIPSTLGEDTMSDKKTNLDMFLEGIESVEVSKKPKFHSIHRLYEAKDEDETKDEVEKNKECGDEDDSEEQEAGEGEDSEEGSEESDEGEEEGEEEAKDDEEVEKDMEEASGLQQTEAALRVAEALVAGGAALINKLANKGIDLISTLASAKDEIQKIAPAKGDVSNFDKFAAEKRSKSAMASAAAKNVPGAGLAKEEDEIEEGVQGYAAGLKGVRKDAGAKSLKSGSNKVPTPKVAITGDKKLLKKPTTLKGDTYPKSSVAGAARPGAPKVKKS